MGALGFNRFWYTWGSVVERNIMTESVVNELSPTRRILVRAATQADLPQIIHIARVTWDITYKETIAPENRRAFLARAYKPENLADGLEAPGHWFYVAEVASEIVGFGHFLQRYHPSRARAELMRLYVLPTYQSMGIGTEILQTGFAALAEAGIEQCFVSVQATNSAARKFYERHGFTFYGNHGQFLGTQIVTLAEYVRSIDKTEALL
jgi:ribosomal protein S18 acetylase RimI-like enzyme